MNVKLTNCSLTFAESEYKTTLLTADNTTAGSYISWIDGSVTSNADEYYSDIFPYNGGDLIITFAESLAYGKAVVAFFTNNDGTGYKRFKDGSKTTNGLEEYITGTPAQYRYNYLIPEADIKALGSIKYFRIGALRENCLGVSTIKYHK